MGKCKGRDKSCQTHFRFQELALIHLDSKAELLGKPDTAGAWNQGDVGYLGRLRKARQIVHREAIVFIRTNVSEQ
jgi:hypothetical protein